MTWNAVARKDFEDAVRSRWLWGLSAFFFAFIGGTTAVFFGWIASGSESQATSDSLFGLFASGLLSFSYTGFLGFALAFIALLTAYGSIIDERESGTVKLLLSLPHSRLDVITGKLAGRSAVLVLPVLGGFLVAFVVLLVTGTEVVFENLLPHIALTILLALVFVSIGVGISAAVDTGRQATLWALGSYFLFALLWSMVAQGIPQLITEIGKRVPVLDPLSGAATIKARLLVKYLNPLRAYETLVASIYFGDPIQARLVKAGMFEQLAAQEAFKGSLPFYLQDWLIFLVLVFWLVVPPVLGYLVFRETEL